jgi:ubiquinone/menaquinone biosynthesis C-methylase UbiE
MNKKPPIGSWDDAEEWYGGLVGEKGHHYHQTIILPNALRLLELKAGSSLLDLGCGSGVLARYIPKGVEYTGIDSAKGLLEIAKKQTPGAKFILADASQKLQIPKTDFDAAIFLLSLQNMENGTMATREAALHLKQGGKILLVLNHPCFRIPRQSDWGYDEGSKLQYRRVNSYMSAMKIPIATHPGKGKLSPETFSFHESLSTYSRWLKESGLAIIAMEEWCSDKESQGGRARAENRARKEIPLFLAILSQKL